MREIHDHKTNDTNSDLRITVKDEPGAGGACHLYEIATPKEGDSGGLTIHFQEGPIGEIGINGITQEALLAIVIDRLRSFQAGPYACRENAIALTHVETALLWLKARTDERRRRGVEGTNEK
jgi:hypothetical protein